MEISTILDKLNTEQEKLYKHPLYEEITDLQSLQVFMKYHIFAVFDFMSLLKSIQKEVAPAEKFWQPSQYPTNCVRLINEIVVAEESDYGLPGTGFQSHFDMYLQAMKEVGADTTPIKQFLRGHTQNIPAAVIRFVHANLHTAKEGRLEEVAATFFYGREKVIPNMFDSIVEASKGVTPTPKAFYYYLKRHIELDGDEHGPAAEKFLSHICESSPYKKERALQAGITALRERNLFWNFILMQIQLERSRFLTGSGKKAEVELR